MKRLHRNVLYIATDWTDPNIGLNSVNNPQTPYVIAIDKLRRMVGVTDDSKSNRLRKYAMRI